MISAVLLGTIIKKQAKDGLALDFDKNAGVLVNKQNKLRGTRILGPVVKELKKGKYSKMTSFASDFRN